jgi:hypothetical protein
MLQVERRSPTPRGLRLRHRLIGLDMKMWNVSSAARTRQWSWDETAGPDSAGRSKSECWLAGREGERQRTGDDRDAKNLVETPTPEVQRCRWTASRLKLTTGLGCGAVAARSPSRQREELGSSHNFARATLVAVHRLHVPRSWEPRRRSSRDDRLVRRFADRSERIEAGHAA